MPRKIDDLVCEMSVSLDESCSVQQAAELMTERNVGSLLVTSDGKVIGLFTERDLLKRVVGKQRVPDETPLSQVCTRDLITISHNSSAKAAIWKMRSNKCRRLLVYRDKELQGMVKLRDVANVLAEQHGNKDILVNLFGGVTLLLVVSVIGMLIYLLPDMLDLAQRVTNN